MKDGRVEGGKERRQKTARCRDAIYRVRRIEGKEEVKEIEGFDTQLTDNFSTIT